MKMHGSLDVQDNLVRQFRFEPETDFPANPQPGRMLFREADRTLYYCAEISDLPAWVPCAQVRSMHRHTQNEAAMEWTIKHDLNINPVMVQAYDAAGNWIVPDAIVASTLDTVTIRFNIPVAGQALILRGQFIGQADTGAAFGESFTSATTWTINHGLGYNPDIKVYVGNKMVQPQSITHTDTMTAVVTFTEARAGFVTCA